MIVYGKPSKKKNLFFDFFQTPPPSPPVGFPNPYSGEYRLYVILASNQHQEPIRPCSPLIPRTHNGALIQKLRGVEENLTKLGPLVPRLKLVEQAGVMIKSLLTKEDPWSSRPCSHPQCTTCLGEDQGDCRVRSVLYSNTCLLCKEQGVKVQYLGETARTMIERSREHQGDALSNTQQGKTSHMRTHMAGSHPGDLAEILTSFRMHIVKSTSSALERQIREDIQISRAPPGSILNSKEEYNRCVLPRIVIEGPKPVKDQEM